MPQITFRKIDDEEAIIFHDGKPVGDLYRHEDPLTGRPAYLVLLADDHRGWVAVHDRAQVCDSIRSRLRSHPTMSWCY